MFSLFEIAFYVVALCIIVFSVLAVTTSSILRSATYLLFVLLSTGGIYAILGYTFLSAVQLMVYAGGIIVLYVFSILLTRSSETMKYKIRRGKMPADMIDPDQRDPEAVGKSLGKRQSDLPLSICFH